MIQPSGPLSSVIQKTLQSLGFDELMPMQQRMLEVIKDQKDILLLSPTGSGKTLGFLLPVLTRLIPDRDEIQALIIVPSRELVIQIESVFRQMQTGFKVNSCYGGHSVKTELNNFTTPSAVLVGTPGRLADHLRRKSFNPQSVKLLVLDEFDKSLELGFTSEMEEVLNQLPNLEKRILTSATQAIEIPEFTGIKNFQVLNFLESGVAPNIAHKMVRAKGNDKLEAAFQLICFLGNEPTLLFCTHREAVERISEHLKNRRIEHGVFHGGLDQDDRERALIKFRNGSHQLLVTTDLASRGLDIPEIRHIIHYQMPANREAFIHRTGRTARMNASGNSFLVLTEEEPVPEFITEQPELFVVPENCPLPEPQEWQTLYVGCGKKEKVNKIDLVGLFLQKGNLKKEELGKIEVLDHMAFVAVKRSKANRVAQLLRNEKIKKNDLKIRIAR